MRANVAVGPCDECTFLWHPSSANTMPRRSHAEQQVLREKVLELHRQGNMSLAAIAKHPQVQCPRSTVQHIIKNFSERETAKRASRAPKSVVTPRYAFGSLKSSISVSDVRFRYRNSLKRLADKHPFWGCRQLAEHLHQNMVAGLQNRPPGAVVQVRNVIYGCYHISRVSIPLFRSHTNHPGVL